MIGYASEETVRGISYLFNIIRFMNSQSSSSQTVGTSTTETQYLSEQGYVTQDENNNNQIVHQQDVSESAVSTLIQQFGIAPNPEMTIRIHDFSQRPNFDPSWTLLDLIRHRCPMGWDELFGISERHGHFIVPTQKILEARSNGLRVMPDQENIFATFDRITPYNVRIIILAQDPYSGISPDGRSQSTGVALESRYPAEKCQPSLLNVIKKIHNEFKANEPFEMPQSGSLKKWNDQGILMLNFSLTTICGESNYHKGIWKPFVIEVIEYCAQVRAQSGKQLILYTMGKEASDIFTSLRARVHHVKSPHSSGNSMYLFNREGNYFTEINKILYEMNDRIIDWFL